MKTRLLFILFLLIVLCCCKYKQQEALPQHGLLWKITGNDIKIPSYLFGTFHGSSGIQILDSIKDFDSIYNSTSQLICEANYPTFKDIKQRSKKDSRIELNSYLKPWPVKDSTYENLLSVRQKNILETVISSDKVLLFLKQANVRPSKLKSMAEYSFNKPSKKDNKLSNNNKQVSSSLADNVLDFKLISLAKKRNMNIVALDSGEEYQAIKDSISRLFSQLSYRTEVDMLIYYLENHQKIDSLKNDFLNKTLTAYLQQDLNLIAEQQKELILSNNTNLFFRKSNKFIEIQEEMLIDERNNMWMKRIPNLIKDNSSFIAVGAGHLVGEEGLINQLRKLNYTVCPIKQNE